MSRSHGTARHSMTGQDRPDCGSNCTQKLAWHQWLRPPGSCLHAAPCICSALLCMQSCCGCGTTTAADACVPVRAPWLHRWASLPCARCCCRWLLSPPALLAQSAGTPLLQCLCASRCHGTPVVMMTGSNGQQSNTGHKAKRLSAHAPQHPMLLAAAKESPTRCTCKARTVHPSASHQPHPTHKKTPNKRPNHKPTLPSAPEPMSSLSVSSEKGMTCSWLMRPTGTDSVGAREPPKESYTGVSTSCCCCCSTPLP